jgi:hypothetical protein
MRALLSSTDVPLLQDHQHALALFDHFTLAAAQGNMHVMEVLAGALALDLRLHLQVGATRQRAMRGCLVITVWSGVCTSWRCWRGRWPRTCDCTPGAC